MAETAKARARRLAAGWFDRFCPPHLSGLDVGCRDDAVHPTFRRWDQIYGDGDATFLEGVPDGPFATVYASHVLEHLDDPVTALRNWWRALAPGGHLCVTVPDWLTYEGANPAPVSWWNQGHRTYWRPAARAPGDGPHVRGLRETLAAAVPDGELVWFREAGPDCTPATATVHATGEYSIEAVLRKPTAAPVPPAHILILSAATPGYDPDGLAAANHNRFARLTGCRQQFLSGPFDPDRPPSWSKLKFIRDAMLAGPDAPPWVFWLDADAVFLRPGDLGQFADPAYDVVIGEDANGVNCGAVLLRTCPRTVRLLEDLWKMGDDWRWRNHSWWEQAAFRHLLETNDNMVEFVKVVSHRLFNSRPHLNDYAEGELVAHFCGEPPDRRAAMVREWAAKLA